MMNEHRLRGQLDALHGHTAHYGCHVGMRSTYHHDRAEYYAGHEEVSCCLMYGSSYVEPQLVEE
jgi:hypothetical protein